MKFTSKQYAQALFESLQESSPKDHDKVIENFVQVLKKNADLSHYEEIIKVYEELDLTNRGVRVAEVTTAHEMKANHEMIEALNKVVGQKIEVKNKVDESLIGGMVIRVDDTLIDASIKGQLDNLKQNLSK